MASPSREEARVELDRRRMMPTAQQAREELARRKNTSDEGKTSALGAFGRSAFNSVPGLMLSLMQKTGLTGLKELPRGPFSEKPGDIEHPIAQTLGHVAGNPLNYNLGKAAIKGGGAIARIASKDIGNIKKYFDLANKEKSIGTAAEDIQNKQESLEGIEQSALENFGLQQPGALRGQGNRLQSQAQKLNEKYGNVPETEIPHTSPKYEGQNLVSKAAQEEREALLKLSEAEERMSHHENIGEEANQSLEDAAKAHQEHLYAGKTHKAHIGSGIKRIQEEVIKPSITKKYETVTKNTENKGTMVPSSPENETLLKSIRDSYSKAPGMSAEAKEAAIQKMYNMNKGPEELKHIPAKDMISEYRSYRDFVNNMARKSRTTGIDAQERQAIEDALPGMRKNLDKLDSVLQDTLGSDDYNLFKEANAEWREKVTPTYGNPMWRDIYKKERVSNDFINSTVGAEPGDILAKNIVKSDPNLLRMAVGQRIANKPEAMHSYNEALEEYTDLMPELKKISQEHRAALEKTSQAEKDLHISRSAHKKAASLASQAERNFAEAEKQQMSLKSKAEKSAEEEMSLRSHEEKRKSALEEIPKLEKRAKEFHEESMRLQKAKNEKNISLKKKMALEKEYNANKADIAKTKKRLYLLGTAIGIKKIAKTLL